MMLSKSTRPLTESELGRNTVGESDQCSGSYESPEVLGSLQRSGLSRLGRTGAIMSARGSDLDAGVSIARVHRWGVYQRVLQ